MKKALVLFAVVLFIFGAIAMVGCEAENDFIEEPFEEEMEY